MGRARIVGLVMLVSVLSVVQGCGAFSSTDGSSPTPVLGLHQSPVLASFDGNPWTVYPNGRGELVVVIGTGGAAEIWAVDLVSGQTRPLDLPPVPGCDATPLGGLDPVGPDTAGILVECSASVSGADPTLRYVTVADDLSAFDSALATDLRSLSRSDGRMRFGVARGFTCSALLGVDVGTVTDLEGGISLDGQRYDLASAYDRVEGYVKVDEECTDRLRLQLPSVSGEGMIAMAASPASIGVVGLGRLDQAWRLYLGDSLEDLRSVSGDLSYVTDVQWSPGGGSVAVANATGVTIFDADGALELQIDAAEVKSVAWVDDCGLAVLASQRSETESGTFTSTTDVVLVDVSSIAAADSCTLGPTESVR